MKQIIIKTGQVTLIVFGVLLIQGALGSSDNLAISFNECLIRCLIGMAMIAGAIWIPRIIHNRKKKAPRVAATTQEGQSNKNIN